MFVLVRNSRSRFHGHDHEDSALYLFEQPANRVFKNLLVPHFARCVDDPIEFAPHLFFAHHFGINAAEAALRAKRELIQRQIPACLIDAPFELINSL